MLEPVMTAGAVMPTLAGDAITQRNGIASGHFTGGLSALYHEQSEVKSNEKRSQNYCTCRYGVQVRFGYENELKMLIYSPSNDFSFIFAVSRLHLLMLRSV
jgi:hypothetical protein